MCRVAAVIHHNGPSPCAPFRYSASLRPHASPGCVEHLSSAFDECAIRGTSPSLINSAPGFSYRPHYKIPARMGLCLPDFFLLFPPIRLVAEQFEVQHVVHQQRERP